MDEKEIRLQCLGYAFKYLDYYLRIESEPSTYKTETGVIHIAERFEKYVRNGE